MMNRKIAVMLMALPIGVLPLGTIAFLSQSASAAESPLLAAERQAPIVVAQRYDDRRDRDQEAARREAARREQAQREQARREEARRNEARRVWVPGHWESGFLGIGRKWVEGHWSQR